MSLIIEQRLDNNTFTDSGPKIYTTGASLIPLEIFNNNKRRYVWVVNEFDDDSYNQNGEICHPNLYCDQKKNLFR